MTQRKGKCFGSSDGKRSTKSKHLSGKCSRRIPWKNSRIRGQHKEVKMKRMAVAPVLSRNPVEKVCYRSLYLYFIPLFVLVNDAATVCCWCLVLLLLLKWLCSNTFLVGEQICNNFHFLNPKFHRFIIFLSSHPPCRTMHTRLCRSF